MGRTVDDGDDNFLTHVRLGAINDNEPDGGTTMGNGPSDKDFQLAQRYKEETSGTAKAMGSYVDANKLNPAYLRQVLDKHAPGNDADGDGVYEQQWLSVETFYRFTEEYVAPEKRIAYKMELERLFPGKKGVL